MPLPLERALNVLNKPSAGGLMGGGLTVSGVGVALAAVEGAVVAGAVVGTAGAALIVIPLGIAIKKYAFPKKREKVSQDFSDKIDTESFHAEDWDCYWSLGFLLGNWRAGKTHLKRRLLGDDALIGDSGKTTSGLEINICKLKEEIFIALLDTKGSFERNQKGQGASAQSKLLTGVLQELKKEKKNQRRSIVVMLILDNCDPVTEGVNKRLADQDRLSIHEHYIEEVLINKFSRSDLDNISELIILMNKADLWETGDDVDRLNDWAEEQRTKLMRALSIPVSKVNISALDTSHPGYFALRQKLIDVCDFQERG